MSRFPMFIGLTLGFAVLASIATRGDPTVFDRWFAGLPPVLVVVGAAIVGVPALSMLERRGWNLTGHGSSVQVLVLGAVLLACVPVLMDLVLRFPEDINIAWPRSLAAYPVIAFVVEIVLHAVPLAILVLVFGSPDSTGEGKFWVFAFVVALLEAALQVMFADRVATAVFSGSHLIVIGVFQLWLFRRFGFLPMLGFRLTYYAVWHIAWGAARLPLLF